MKIRTLLSCLVIALIWYTAGVGYASQVPSSERSISRGVGSEQTGQGTTVIKPITIRPGTTRQDNTEQGSTSLLVIQPIIGDVQILSVNVSPPATQCKNSIDITVRNNTNQQMNNLHFKLRRSSGSGPWFDILYSQFQLAPNETRSFNFKMVFTVNDTNLKVSVYKDYDTIMSEVESSIPMINVNDVEILNIALNDTSWAVTVRNNSPSFPLCEPSINTAISSPSSPNTWVPTGGTGLSSTEYGIDPGSQDTFFMPKPSGWKNGYSQIRVRITQSSWQLHPQDQSMIFDSELVLEQIFPIN